MRLELKDIKEGLLEQEYTCLPDDFPELVSLAEERGPRFLPPLEFRLRFQRVGRIVEVDGDFTAIIGLNCGRCLDAFELKVADRFSLTFSPAKEDENREEEVELTSGELGLLTYRDDVLELTEALQEQLLMALPISPLCDSDCQGLCPECGQNLNIKDCGCVRTPFNNKFAALAGMAFNKKQKE